VDSSEMELYAVRRNFLFQIRKMNLNVGIPKVWI